MLSKSTLEKGEGYLLPAVEGVTLDSYPKVSFCIPTFNGERTIRRCLESIQCQDYADLEIVVVDDNSTDRSSQIAREFTDKVYSLGAPLGRLRQFSVEKSTGQVLALFDDDIVIPHKLWLKEAVKQFFAYPRVSTIWFRYISPAGASLVNRCYINHNDLIFKDRVLHHRGVFGGGNSLFLREAFEDVGGFDTDVDFGEDMVLARALKDRGYKVVYSPDPLIHDTMFSLRSYYRKHCWGAGAISARGMELMQVTRLDVLREQYWVGFLGMLRGLLIHRDASWFMFPALIGVKSIAYGSSRAGRAASKIKSLLGGK